MSTEHDSSPLVDLEKVSRLCELFVGIFYAEAYREIITKGFQKFEAEEPVWEVVLPFLVFLFVTARFLIGNFLHLNDSKWKSGWNRSSTRRLYYFDAFCIGLESLAMILLGSLAYRRQLVPLLIIISLMDVFWIALQWLSQRLKVGSRPVEIPYKWMALNITVALLLGFGAWGGWSTLWWVLGVNFAAFVADVIIVNQPRA